MRATEWRRQVKDRIDTLTGAADNLKETATERRQSLLDEIEKVDQDLEATLRENDARIQELHKLLETDKASRAGGDDDDDDEDDEDDDEAEGEENGGNNGDQ